MSELERQLTEALKTLSVQYERAQRRHSGQIEALHGYVEVLREYVEVLRQHAERQSGESEALRTRIEWLDGQPAGEANHGRESYKSNWDCTICVSCH